jgi:hypothetical protein
MQRFENLNDARQAYESLVAVNTATTAPGYRAWLVERIAWLKQKLAAQRTVGGPEFDNNPLLIGRTQGNIGALEDALRQYDAKGGL